MPGCWLHGNRHSRLSASSSLATTMRVIPARPRLMYWPDGSGPRDSSSRFRSRRSPKPTGMMCTGCVAVEAKFLSAHRDAAQGARRTRRRTHLKSKLVGWCLVVNPLMSALRNHETASKEGAAKFGDQPYG